MHNYRYTLCNYYVKLAGITQPSLIFKKLGDIDDKSRKGSIVHYCSFSFSVSFHAHPIFTRLSKTFFSKKRFLKNCCKVAKLKDDIIKHRLNPISSIKTLVKHQLRVICIMGGLTIVFLSTRQKFESGD